MSRRYGVYLRKQPRGDVDHTFLTSLVDQTGTLRVQYLGVRFDPEEFYQDLRTCVGRRWPSRTPVRQWLPRLVARIPASIHAKLLVGFLVIVGLLVAVGAVGLQVLNTEHHRAEDLVKLQRKIAAYRQLQHDTTAQLYTVASALLVPEDRTLDATLRQLNQFGYDLDRLQFVAKDEVELLGRVRQDYDQFIQVVSRVVELIRTGRAAEGRELQLAQSRAAGRPAGTADQRAGQQGRGRHGGQHRGQRSGLRDAPATWSWRSRWAAPPWPCSWATRSPGR